MSGIVVDETWAVATDVLAECPKQRTADIVVSVGVLLLA